MYFWIFRDWYEFYNNYDQKIFYLSKKWYFLKIILVIIEILRKFTFNFARKKVDN